MIVRSFIALLFLTNSTLLSSQIDSLNSIFSYREYIENILAFHPIARQADLLNMEFEAFKLSAKGNFDPVITSQFDQKRFDEKLYYSQYQAKLVVPTRLGIDVIAGYENIEGVFVNPENSTTNSGLWNIGIKANLLQGLMIDERRTALQQAEVFQKMTENERIILLNDLLYDASSAYLNWQNAYYSKEIIIENIDLANIYLANTKLAFDNGEKTQMDTLEARIALQEANNQLIATEIIITASRQNAENYLWLDNLPLEILPSTAPERFTADFLLIDTSTDIDDLIDAHPIIQSKINKLSFYELEQRWKREKLKPKLSINFNPLLATTTTIAPTYASSDYKWSVDFSMPLLFRSEKAEVTRGNIKIQNVALDIDNKRLELKNKIENTLFQQSLLKDQINLLEDNIRGYRLLLDGENDKFLLGESSVFLVNKRQEKYIMSRLKLLELTLKLQKESLSYLYYSNQLINPYLN